MKIVENNVRAVQIENGMKVTVSKDKFIELLSTELGIKLAAKFEIHIKEMDSELVTIEFKHKDQESIWDRFIEITDFLNKNS